MLSLSLPPSREVVVDHCLNSHHFERRRRWHAEAKIIDFASLISCLADARKTFKKLLLFFSRPFQLPLWFHHARPLLSSQPFEMRKRPVIQLLKLQSRLLGSWEKTCSTNPTVTKRTLCYLTVCGSHLIYSLFKMLLLSILQRGSQSVAHPFC